MLDLIIGDDAPLFSLPSTTGKPVDLTELRGKWIVLYFYPKDDTSGCTTEARGFRDAMKDLTKFGVQVLGVNCDDIASHEKFAKKNKLNFPLLSDVKQKVVEDYGVLTEKSFLGKNKVVIARTTFVIDPGGRIAKVFTNVKPEKHHQEVLEYLKTIMTRWVL